MSSFLYLLKLNKSYLHYIPNCCLEACSSIHLKHVKLLQLNSSSTFIMRQRGFLHALQYTDVTLLPSNIESPSKYFNTSLV